MKLRRAAAASHDFDAAFRAAVSIAAGAGDSAEEFGRLIKSEMERWAKLMKEAGLKAD